MKEEKHAKKTKEALFISWLSLPYREEILPRAWSARKTESTTGSRGIPPTRRGTEKPRRKSGTVM